LDEPELGGTVCRVGRSDRGQVAYLGVDEAARHVLHNEVLLLLERLELALEREYLLDDGQLVDGSVLLVEVGRHHVLERSRTRDRGIAVLQFVEGKREVAGRLITLVKRYALVAGQEEVQEWVGV